ncbi:MAG: PepSY domain-containing protein, partial [Marinirhabdus sp.]
PLQMARAEKANPYSTIKWSVLPDWAWAHPTYRFEIANGKKIKNMVIDASQLMADIERGNNTFGTE